MKKLAAILLLLLFAGLSHGQNNGTTFSNVPIAGSSASWSNTTNVQVSDNSYASTASLMDNHDYTDYLVVSGFGFSIPSGSVIDGITVEVEGWNAGNKNLKDDRARIVKNGVIGSIDKSTGGSWPMSDANTYISYGGASDLWSDTWTAADINSSNFGFAISMSRNGNGNGISTADPRIDHIRITVSYSSGLPIELTSFSATSDNNKVVISWCTASETNNDYFTVDRTGDGINFQEIGKIAGSGTSTTANSYGLVDYKPIDGISYYRLKQTDYDGKCKYFKLIEVENFNTQPNMLVYPNPNNGHVFVSINNCESFVTIVVNDTFGRLVYKSTEPTISGKLSTVIDMYWFASGTYSIEIASGGTVVKQSLIKR